jgi:hypothetical protein
MLTADFGNGQTISGDGAVTGYLSGLQGGAGLLQGSAQVQELQQALRAYGQSAGLPTAAAVQPTGQVDSQTLMALAQLAPQLKARVGRQIPDRVWEMIVALGGSPTTVVADQLNVRVMGYAGLLADAVRALTYARYTGGTLTPPVPRPVISLGGGGGGVPTWVWVLGGVAVLGAVAFFFMRR